MPVTDPVLAVQRHGPVGAGAAMLNVMSVLPSVSAASSANGATGTSSGTLTRARSDVRVDAEDGRPDPAAVGADHGDARAAPRGRRRWSPPGHPRPRPHRRGGRPRGWCRPAAAPSEWPAACGRRRDRLALHGQRGHGDVGALSLVGEVTGGPRPGRAARWPRPRRPGPRRRRSSIMARGWRMAIGRVSGGRGGPRRQLARVPPEAVVGVDPAAQRGVGAVGGTARIVLFRSLFRWLLGCRGHAVRLPMRKAEMRSAPLLGRTMRPDVARSGH